MSTGIFLSPCVIILHTIFLGEADNGTESRSVENDGVETKSGEDALIQNICPKHSQSPLSPKCLIGELHSRGPGTVILIKWP